MDDVLLHRSTRSNLESFFKAPSHAICLVGAAGAGKAFLAQKIATALLGEATADAIHMIVPSPNSISIEQIRGLQHFLRLKKPGTKPIKRVVIIENAETMGDEAQNALLKTLEEPPTDTVFILTTDGSATLKPTIYSRVQKIQVMPVSLEEATEAFSDSSSLMKSYHLSGGYVGLLYNLMNDSDHELVTAVEDAKKLMRASTFERLVLVDTLAKNKEGIPNLIYALERVVGAALAGASTNAQVKRLVSSLRALYEAKIDLQKSANTKLLLTDLFLGL